jgi:hypothetical protein
VAIETPASSATSLRFVIFCFLSKGFALDIPASQ